MKAQVLLVEDDRSVRDSLERALQSEDYAVVATPDSTQARQVLQNQHIDLVLMDVDSAQADDWDGAQEIVRSQMFLPVVLITARTGQHHHAAATGADVLMEKPLNLTTLVETMSHLLEQTLQGRLHRLEEAY